MKIVLRKETPPKKLAVVLKKKSSPSDPLSGSGYYEDAAWGIRIVIKDAPIAWVKDARNGEPLRKEHARCIGRGKDGNYYWIREGENLYIGDKARPSVWKKGEMP